MKVHGVSRYSVGFIVSLYLCVTVIPRTSEKRYKVCDGSTLFLYLGGTSIFPLPFTFRAFPECLSLPLIVGRRQYIIKYARKRASAVAKHPDAEAKHPQAGENSLISRRLTSS